jgi:hypothetical protein
MDFRGVDNGTAGQPNPETVNRIPAVGARNSAFCAANLTRRGRSPKGGAAVAEARIAAKPEVTLVRAVVILRYSRDRR